MHPHTRHRVILVDHQREAAQASQGSERLRKGWQGGRAAGHGFENGKAGQRLCSGSLLCHPRGCSGGCLVPCAAPDAWRLRQGCDHQVQQQALSPLVLSGPVRHVPQAPLSPCEAKPAQEGQHEGTAQAQVRLAGSTTARPFRPASHRPADLLQSTHLQRGRVWRREHSLPLQVHQVLERVRQRRAAGGREGARLVAARRSLLASGDLFSYRQRG